MNYRIIDDRIKIQIKNSLVLLCFIVTAAFSAFVGGQVKTIKVKKANLKFSTEVEFTNWLAKVQFIGADEVQIYYHKGFRFKLLPKGGIMRTRASIDHAKRTITWISKTDNAKSVTSVLTIDEQGKAHLKKGDAKPTVLEIKSR